VYFYLLDGKQTKDVLKNDSWRNLALLEVFYRIALSC